MHIAGFESMSVNLLDHFQVGSVHIDGIVHHTFIQSVDRGDFSFTLRKMGCIGLSSEIAGVVFSFQTYTKTIHRDVIT